jgi:uroporphyrinogen-III decarboxylase
MEQVLLAPTKRIIKAFQAGGSKAYFHNCGLIDNFIPYLVDEIGSDALQIQTINDTKGILQKYGDRVTVEYRLDPTIMYDPDTTPDQARSLVREVIDKFGAHTNPGAGVVIAPQALKEEVYYAVDDEIYTYSLQKYKEVE